jgi:hypothetical protein
MRTLGAHVTFNGGASTPAPSWSLSGTPLAPLLASPGEQRSKRAGRSGAVKEESLGNPAPPAGTGTPKAVWLLT